MTLELPVQRPGRRPPRIRQIAVRLTDETLKAIDSRAEREERTRSDMVRILLIRGMNA